MKTMKVTVDLRFSNLIEWFLQPFWVDSTSTVGWWWGIFNAGGDFSCGELKKKNKYGNQIKWRWCEEIILSCSNVVRSNGRFKSNFFVTIFLHGIYVGRTTLNLLPLKYKLFCLYRPLLIQRHSVKFYFWGFEPKMMVFWNFLCQRTYSSVSNFASKEKQQDAGDNCSSHVSFTGPVWSFIIFLNPTNSTFISRVILLASLLARKLSI